jgi:YbgC/YbaW family acyl-CoA thioester hydrolase
MFEYETGVKLQDTDAAGLVFFANHFKIAHAVYEAFMESIGCGLHLIIRESAYLLPIVHAEADYKAALSLGDALTISVTADVGKTSFTLSYDFKDGQGEMAARVRTVHVAVDKETGEKITLPDEVREGFLRIS